MRSVTSTHHDTSHDIVEQMSSPIDASVRPRIDLGGVRIDPVTQAETVARVVQGWHDGRGGLIVTPNIDIWRAARRDPTSAVLIEGAELVLADGQPLVIASRIVGQPFPERVTGSGLVEPLCATASREGQKVFIIGGGPPDTADRAADALKERHPGLTVVGALVPPYGFEQSPETLDEIVRTVVDAQPGLVFVGLGFPKQERLAMILRERLPHAWLLGCGGGIGMAAGQQRRCPAWAQRIGAEWIFRLAQEPQRLAHRYLVDDIPAALTLLAWSAKRRLRG